MRTGAEDSSWAEALGRCFPLALVRALKPLVAPPSSSCLKLSQSTMPARRVVTSRSISKLGHGLLAMPMAPTSTCMLIDELRS